MRRVFLWITVLAVVFSFLPVSAPVARAGTGTPVYVAVGDSLSVGFQPGRGRTDHGYVDDLSEGHGERSRHCRCGSSGARVRRPGR